MDTHGKQQQNDATPIRQWMWPRVNPNQHPVEKVAGENKVQLHNDMANMRSHEPTEGRSEVKTVEPDDINKENKKDLGTVRLGPNDAQLDYVIEKSKLTLYVYTDKSANSYTYEIPREKLRTQILELNLAHISSKDSMTKFLISVLSVSFET